MTIDLTNFTGLSSFQGVAFVTNNYTGGLLFTGGIIVFFIILLMSLLKFEQPFENALAISSWSMFTVSAFFWFAKLTPTILPLMFLMLAAFATMYLYSSKSPY